jgi:prepilin-type N-terminal cleavage/methylation domain-containing protein
MQIFSKINKNQTNINIKPHQGFTLLEIMVTIGIAGILTMMSLPPLISWVQNKSSQQNAQQIINVIKAARQTAIATKVPEVLVFTPGNYNAPAKIALSIQQVGSNSRKHQISSKIAFIQMTQGGGGLIDQIRFNGFGLAQALATGGWQNNRMQILLDDYGINISQQGLTDMCVRDAQLTTPSMAVC